MPFLLILGSVLSTLLLMQCGGAPSKTLTSIPTSAPSQTSLPSPKPTKTLEPTPTARYVSVTPLVTAPYIQFGSWPADSQWIAYWVSSQQDVEQPTNYMPGGTLNFRKVATGETCAVPQFVRPDNRAAEVRWSEEDEAIILWGEEAFVGKPCQDEPFRKLDNYVEEPLGDPALSPDEEYRADTVLDSSENGILTFTTRITTAGNTQSLQSRIWQIDERLGEYGLGGEWISREQFLIYETLEQGPLILDVERGVIPVLTQLFGLSKIPSIVGSEEYGLRAIPLPGPERDSLHLLLQGVGTETNFPWIKVYHAENELVETLPFKYMWWKPFSDDGQWLLMDKQPTIDGFLRHEIWIRRVEDVNGNWQMIASSVDSVLWTSDSSEMAFSNAEKITWQTFPGAERIGQWSTDGYWTYPAAFSPDGRFLVTIGNIPGLSKYGLFVLER